MCPHTAMYVSSYCYGCVLILLYVSSYYYMRAQRALQDSILLHMCPHTAICVRILLCVSSISHELVFLFFYFRLRTRSPRSRTACYYICLHTALSSSYCYVCVSGSRTNWWTRRACCRTPEMQARPKQQELKKKKKKEGRKKMEKKEGFLLRFKCMCRICPQLATDTEARRCREAAAPYIHIYMSCNRRRH